MGCECVGVNVGCECGDTRVWGCKLVKMIPTACVRVCVCV